MLMLLMAARCTAASGNPTDSDLEAVEPKSSFVRRELMEPDVSTVEVSPHGEILVQNQQQQQRQLQQQEHYMQRKVSNFSVGSAGIMIGDMLVFWNSVHKKYFHLTPAGKIGLSAVRNQAAPFPVDWKNERFMVVDGGNGLIALHNSYPNRFLRMSNTTIDSSPTKTFNVLPDNWAWERFQIVVLGNKYALYCPSHSRFMYMTSNGMARTNVHKVADTNVLGDDVKSPPARSSAPRCLPGVARSPLPADQRRGWSTSAAGISASARRQTCPRCCSTTASSTWARRSFRR